VAGVTHAAFPGPEAFRPYIGSDFSIEEGALRTIGEGAHRTVEEGAQQTVGERAQHTVLTLAEVSDSGVSNGMHQYSLLFHGPADRILPERIHTLRHPSLGTLEIFIVPVVGSNALRTIYQACFSRPADSVHERPE